MDEGGLNLGRHLGVPMVTRVESDEVRMTERKGDRLWCIYSLGEEMISGVYHDVRFD